jgi:hypothetical protein
VRSSRVLLIPPQFIVLLQPDIQIYKEDSINDSLALFSSPENREHLSEKGDLTSALTAERKLVAYCNQGERMAPFSALRTSW